MPALNVNTLVQDEKYLIHSSLYPVKGPIKYIGKTPHGYLKFIIHDPVEISFDPNTTQIYNVNATDYPVISAPVSSSITPSLAGRSVMEKFKFGTPVSIPSTSRGGKRYTTHKQRKHKSRKSRKGRKSQKRRRS